MTNCHKEIRDAPGWPGKSHLGGRALSIQTSFLRKSVPDIRQKGYLLIHEVIHDFLRMIGKTVDALWTACGKHARLQFWPTHIASHIGTGALFLTCGSQHDQ